MRMHRNTSVDALVERVNDLLALPDDGLPGAHTKPRVTTPGEAKAYRHALCDLVTFVLHETNRYAGFGYQESEFLPPADTHAGTIRQALRDDYDDTRRVYRAKEYKR